jgi:hypothetical protein
MVQQNMFNIKHLPLNCLYVGISLALMSAAVTPASAQSVIIINGSGVYQHPTTGYSVYGNSRRVYPQTVIKQRRGYNYYPDVRQNLIIPPVVHPGARFKPYGHDYRHPGIRQNFVNPRVTYPQVVYPGTRLTPYGTGNFQQIMRPPVHPATVNNSWRRTPFRGRSRVILQYSY